eukprot:330146_1
MNYLQHLFLLFLSCILSIGVCDISDDSYANRNNIEDRYPIAHHGAGPEKPLPNDYVHDSHEPNNYEPDWKTTIHSVVSIAAIVQVIIVAFYICVSRACCIKINSSLFDEYPSKPWDVENELTYDRSERKYLSKDDGIQDEADFDTDPEDLEVY